MVKITLPDGTTVEGVADEAVRAAKLMRPASAAGNSPSAVSSREPVPSREPAPASTNPRPLTESAKRLVTILLSYGPGVDTPTHVVAGRLGTTGSKLGGDVSTLLTWGKQLGLSKDDLIVGGRKSNGSGETVR